MNAPWPGAALAGLRARRLRRASSAGALARLWRRTVAQVRVGRLRTRSRGSSRRRSRRSPRPCCCRRPGIRGARASPSRPTAGSPRPRRPRPPQRRCGALQAGALDRAAAWSRAAGRPGAARGRRGARRGATVVGLRRIADARMLSWLRWPYANVPARPGDQPGDRARPRAAGDAATTSTRRAWARSTRRTRASSPGRRMGWSLDARDGRVHARPGRTTLPSGAPGRRRTRVSEVWLGRRRYSGGLPPDADRRARRAPHGRPRRRAGAAGRGRGSPSPRRRPSPLAPEPRRRVGCAMLRYEAHTDAAPDTVWALLACPTRWSAWAPHVRRRMGPRLAAGARGRDRRGAAVRGRPGPARGSRA